MSEQKVYSIKIDGISQSYDDTAKLVKEISDLRKAYDNLSASERTNESIGGKIEKQIASLEKTYKSLVNESNTYNQALAKNTEQIKKTQTETKSLESVFGELEDQLRQMRFDGVDPTSEAYQNLQEQAVAVRRAINDTTEELDAAVSKTAGLDRIVSLGNSITATFGATQSVMALFGKDTEQVEKYLQKAAAAFTLVNQVQTVYQNIVKKGTLENKAYMAVMNALGLSKQKYAVQTKASTVATTAESTAQKGLAASTVASTVATTGLSTAMKVLRTAIISTGIGALVVLLGTLIGNADKIFSLFKSGADDAERLANRLSNLDRLIGAIGQRSESVTNDYEKQKSAIEQYYELEIAKANGNKDKIIQLEREKFTALSKLRNDYNKEYTASLLESFGNSNSKTGGEIFQFFNDINNKNKFLETFNKSISQYSLAIKDRIEEFDALLKNNNLNEQYKEIVQSQKDNFINASNKAIELINEYNNIAKSISDLREKGFEDSVISNSNGLKQFSIELTDIITQLPQVREELIKAFTYSSVNLSGEDSENYQKIIDDFIANIDKNVELYNKFNDFVFNQNNSKELEIVWQNILNEESAYFKERLQKLLEFNKNYSDALGSLNDEIEKNIITQQKNTNSIYTENAFNYDSGTIRSLDSRIANLQYVLEQEKIILNKENTSILEALKKRENEEIKTIKKGVEDGIITREDGNNKIKEIQDKYDTLETQNKEMLNQSLLELDKKYYEDVAKLRDADYNNLSENYDKQREAAIKGYEDLYAIVGRYNEEGRNTDRWGFFNIEEEQNRLSSIRDYLEQYKKALEDAKESVVNSYDEQISAAKRLQSNYDEGTYEYQNYANEIDRLEKEKSNAISDYDAKIISATNELADNLSQSQSVVQEWFSAFAGYFGQAASIINDMVSTISDNISAGFDVTLAELDAQIEEVTARHDAVLEDYNESTERIKALQEELEGADATRSLVLGERIDREIELKRKLAKEEKELAKEQERLEREQSEAEYKQKKAQFNAQRIQAIVNTASAIAINLGSYPWPYSLIPVGIVTAMGAIQQATISAQIKALDAEYAGKFAKGGIINGKSHAEGGVKLEAEGGEYIVRKKSTQENLPLLNYINKAEHKVNLSELATVMNGTMKFANGGVVPQINSNDSDINRILKKLDSINFQPVVAVTDINRVNQQMVRVSEIAGE